MIPIKEIMAMDVKYVYSDTSIMEALEMLKKYRVSGFPVVDQDMRVIGMLSEKDVLRILFDNKPVVDYTVENYMSRDVISFTEEDDAVEICKVFIHKPIRQVPIVKGGRLVGIVSRKDIISVILDAKSKFSDLRYV